jgi:hypothetical protein
LRGQRLGGAWLGSASARTPRVCSRAGRRNASHEQAHGEEAAAE